MAYTPNFKKDFASGQSAERYILGLLNREGSELTASQNNGATRSKLAQWDISVLYKNAVSGFERKFTIECKFDIREKETGNLAIEYHNCFADKPSGLFATKADLYAYVLNPKSVYVANVAALRHYFTNAAYIRDVSGAGDGNANIRLFKSSKILLDVFTRIDNLEAKVMTKEIMAVLQNSTKKAA